MKVRILPGCCQGHNNCSRIAPQLFELDEQGYAVVRLTAKLPVELEELAELAAENCPEGAIEIEAEHG